MDYFAESSNDVYRFGICCPKHQVDKGWCTALFCAATKNKTWTKIYICTEQLWHSQQPWHAGHRSRNYRITSQNCSAGREHKAPSSSNKPHPVYFPPCSVTVFWVLWLYSLCHEMVSLEAWGSVAGRMKMSKDQGMCPYYAQFLTLQV